MRLGVGAGAGSVANPGKATAARPPLVLTACRRHDVDYEQQEQRDDQADQGDEGRDDLARHAPAGEPDENRRDRAAQPQEKAVDEDAGGPDLPARVVDFWAVLSCLLPISP